MTNLLKTIEPKSDQLNFDDFVGGKTITAKITKVSAVSGDQPIAVHLEGFDGKPFKPCKLMRRVMVHIWGPDGSAYVGRYLTLFGDPTVRFGNEIRGGVRISHMSNMAETTTIALTVTRAQRKPFTVKPLSVAGAVAKEAHPDVIKQGEEAAKGGVEAYKQWFEKLSPEVRATIKNQHAAWKLAAQEADKEKIAVTVSETGDDYPADNGEGDPEPT